MINSKCYILETLSQYLFLHLLVAEKNINSRINDSIKSPSMTLAVVVFIVVLSRRRTKIYRNIVMFESGLPCLNSWLYFIASTPYSITASTPPSPPEQAC